MKLLLIAAMIPGIASAIVCETDSECLSASLTLIRKATKMGACGRESQALASSIGEIAAMDNGNVRNLELCLFNAKKSFKNTGGREKRLKRINDALLKK